MKRHQLAYFLSGFGVFVFGCQSADSSTTSTSSELSAQDELLASQAFRALPRRVGNEVRAALEAAPGPLSEHATVLLFASPKIFALARVADETSCVTSGSNVVMLLAGWAKNAAALASGENAEQADKRQAKYLDDVRNKLATIDPKNLDAAVDALSCAEGSGSACTARLFDPPSCGGSGGTTNNAGNCTTTSCALLDPSGAPSTIGAPAENALAALFQEAEAVRPSRAMESEWNLLRDRYRAGLTMAARDTLRQARRHGSATLARDAQAGRRFDEAGRMVDAFVRGRIELNVDAMNLVHSAVASVHGGQLRGAADEAFQGRGTSRRYLPGAAVGRATNDAFATVRTLRANNEPAPLVAASFDQRMISIHPYKDANGRTTRLMTDWILAQGGYPPALATNAAPSSVLLWESARIQRDARLEHITEGMRRTVELIERVA